MYNYLHGYVNGERVAIENTVDQIVAFIMEYQSNDTVITTPLDQFVLNTVKGGFIMH